MDIEKSAGVFLSEFLKYEYSRIPDENLSQKINALNKTVKSKDDRLKVSFILQTLEIVYSWRRDWGSDRNEMRSFWCLPIQKGYPFYAVQLVSHLMFRNMPFKEDELIDMIVKTCEPEIVCTGSVPYIKGLLYAVGKHLEDNQMSKPLNAALDILKARLADTYDNPERRLFGVISMMQGGIHSYPILPGEAWSDQAISDLKLLDEQKRGVYFELIEHCRKAKGSKPADKWNKKAQELLDGICRDEFEKYIYSWFPLIDKPRTQPFQRWADWCGNPNLMICEDNADVIKGLVWCCGFFDGKDMARCLRDLALSAYKKVPGVGPRAVKIGNACIYSLGAIEGMDGLEQLAFLKVKVRFKTALKLITSALERKAQDVGVTVEQLEEMSVPEYGLTEVGVLCEKLGDFTARLEVVGTSKTKLTWIKPDGKAQKSVPASVKRDNADELKDIKACAKDIQKMLPAQRDRIDSMFLQDRSWRFSVWKQRYLDHLLIGTLGRRIIWEFNTNAETVCGVFLDGQIVDANDNPISCLDESTSVSLWHPIDKDVESVLAWRDWFERHQVQQPFKQAHREVYLLTDAERQTRVYSNRYAAHIVKQHQFNSLCAVRGWKNTLKLLVDDDFPNPTLTLYKYNIRVEFWTDGAGDEYDVDTNETGTFYYLATDQIRFYDISGEGADRGPGWRIVDSNPMELERVDKLVFSEVMRDVDLFVGVASIGNDPQWQDGGEQGRYYDYWSNWSFGDLNESAKTRKDVVERLIPRLKIRDVCSVDGKFLVVKGSLQTYKIHLGSGNILMKPNDQYLCIVQGRGKTSAADKIFLPFEGDGILSVILSKAFLLADDAKIKDPTILSQINS